MKAFVEFAFILPYYIMRTEKELNEGQSFFTTKYEFFIFSMSIFADYGK